MIQRDPRLTAFNSRRAMASDHLGRHTEFLGERHNGVRRMRFDTVRWPLLQVRQQAPSQDGEVLIAQSVE